MWIGSEVGLGEAKRIAKALREKGVKLQYFGSFRSRRIKTNIIEIGSWASKRALPELSAADIDSFTRGAPRGP